MIQLSVVIPCFNEVKSLPTLLSKFDDVIVRNDIEVIVIDNGSNDNTSIVLKDLLDTYSFLRLIRLEVNKGYGFGIFKGLLQAKGKYIGWTHADLQTDPKDVITALEIIESTNHQRIFVKGMRNGRPISDRLFSIGMSILESIYFQKSLWEVNAQPNLFSRELIQKWDNPPDDFAFDLYYYYLASKENYTIIRFNVDFPERAFGESRWNINLSSKLKFIRRTIFFSIQLKKKLRKDFSK